MPIYEYRCDACGHEHEAIRKFSDPPLTACPACGKEALVKKVSAAAFQLKGSGWYQTDFRNGNKPAAKTDATAEATGAEGKPAAATATPDAAASTKSESAAPAAETSAAPAAKSEAAPATTVAPAASTRPT